MAPLGSLAHLFASPLNCSRFQSILMKFILTISQRFQLTVAFLVRFYMIMPVSLLTGNRNTSDMGLPGHFCFIGIFDLE